MLSGKSADIAILLALFAVVAGSLIIDGNPMAAAAFGAAMLMPLGFGKLLRSDQPASEWAAILAIVLAGLFLWLWGYRLVLAYAGIMMAIQIIIKLVVTFRR